MWRIRRGLRDWYLMHGARGAVREAFAVAGAASMFAGLVALVVAQAGWAAGRLALAGALLLMISRGLGRAR